MANNQRILAPSLILLLSNERTELGIHLQAFLGKLQRILSNPPGIALTETEHALVTEMLPIIEGTIEHLAHEADYFHPLLAAGDTLPASGVSGPWPAEPMASTCAGCDGTGQHAGDPLGGPAFVVCGDCFGTGQVTAP